MENTTLAGMWKRRGGTRWALLLSSDTGYVWHWLGLFHAMHALVMHREMFVKVFEQ